MSPLVIPSSKCVCAGTCTSAIYKSAHHQHSFILKTKSIVRKPLVVQELHWKGTFKHSTLWISLLLCYGHSRHTPPLYTSNCAILIDREQFNIPYHTPSFLRTSCFTALHVRHLDCSVFYQCNLIPVKSWSQLRP